MLETASIKPKLRDARSPVDLSSELTATEVDRLGGQIIVIQTATEPQISQRTAVIWFNRSPPRSPFNPGPAESPPVSCEANSAGGGHIIKLADRRQVASKNSPPGTPTLTGVCVRDGHLPDAEVSRHGGEVLPKG